MVFYTGQKVVFVGKGNFDSVRKWYPELQYPQRDVIYTVRQITYIGGVPGMRLEEIVNPPRSFKEAYDEITWQQHEFRPLVETKTDISVFKENLERHNVKFKPRKMGQRGGS